MKKLFILLFVLLSINSCDNFDNCECYEYPLKDIINKTNQIPMVKSTICHYDALTDTYTTMSFNNDNQLQNHIDTHNLEDIDTVGECIALSIEDYDLDIPIPFLEGECNDNGKELTKINGDKRIIFCY